ncbi:MAG TPA: hypothetical protein VG122_07130 [Gemmata sp.]|jgi:hypothetical protein|nr:hypothetical protein [Gemmata sp.]
MVAVLVGRQLASEWYSLEEFSKLSRIRASTRLSGCGAFLAWGGSRVEIAHYPRGGLIPLKDVPPKLQESW